MSDINSRDDVIEIFDSEDDIVIEPQNNTELYDIKGNLIKSQDAQNTLPDNTDLIQKAIDGNKNAFGELYMQSYRYVFFVVKSFISDDETAYDAIQEVFIKVYKNISKLRSPDAYYGWIAVIAKNTARDFIRTSRYETSLSCDEEDYTEFLKDDATQKDVSLDIEAVLKKLDPDDADLLSLVYYDGMRISQIAKMQGVPATTVYSRFNKAKKNLKAQLNARGIDKAIYSGNFISMVTVAIRNIIGTALLSVAIAQQILDSIINGKGKKELAVAKIIREQQKKAVLKIASVIVAISMVTSAITALTLIDRARFKPFDNDVFTNSDTEHHYELSEGGNQSQNEGGFLDKLFGGESSEPTSNLESLENLIDDSQSSTSTLSSPDTQGTVSQNKDDNPAPQQSFPQNTTSTTEEQQDLSKYANTFGNNPNNVMGNAYSEIYDIVLGSVGLVAKQDDYIYYVQKLSRIMKVKTDGTDSQVIFESSGLQIVQCLNVIGDTIYYINGGIWSIKTDGTNRKQHSTKDARNLLVRGTTGWFIEHNEVKYLYESRYTIYQIDFLTNKIITLVENGNGYGLKTVIDHKLVYANAGNIYTKDLKTGNEECVFKISNAIPGMPSGANMGINSLNIDNNGNLIVECKAFSGSNYSAQCVYRVNSKDPNDAEMQSVKLYNVLNYFDYNGGMVIATDKENGFGNYTLRDIYATDIYKGDKDISANRSAYGFNDGYVYFIDDTGIALCRYDVNSGELKTY